jgi:hypothetical protein
MSKKKSVIDNVFEQLFDTQPHEDVTLETPAPEPVVEEPKQHKAGCQYQRHPFVCNCQ